MENSLRHIPASGHRNGGLLTAIDTQHIVILRDRRSDFLHETELFAWSATSLHLDSSVRTPLAASSVPLPSAWTSHLPYTTSIRSLMSPMSSHLSFPDSALLPHLPHSLLMAIDCVYTIRCLLKIRPQSWGHEFLLDWKGYSPEKHLWDPPPSLQTFLEHPDLDSRMPGVTLRGVGVLLLSILPHLMIYWGLLPRLFYIWVNITKECLSTLTILIHFSLNFPFLLCPIINSRQLSCRNIY